MYKHGYRLKTDADFDNAIYFGYIISIAHESEHLGSGKIKSHNSHFVSHNQSVHFKLNCTFTICSMAWVEKHYT
jgi:hypothetical protein